MYLSRRDSKWLADTPAKLNLYLNVIGKRTDDYHELETVIVPVGLFDSLSLCSARPQQSNSGELNLSIRYATHPPGSSADDLAIPTGKTNLVLRALELLRKQTGCQLGASVQLTKRIPSGAGLGGGSSDAAAALRLANLAWELNLPRSELIKIAAEIGSDVPFFLYDAAAVCRGRGELVEPLTRFPPLHFVVVKPPICLPTAEVFGMLSQQAPARYRAVPRSIRSLATALQSNDFRLLRANLLNVLQPAASALTSSIGELQRVFSSLDVLGHLMTGSGSSFFGICRSMKHARCLAGRLQGQHIGRVFSTTGCH